MSSIDRRLALIPALWLTLASAAPAVTPQALVECRLPRDAAMTALAALPDRAEDLGNGHTAHNYTVPAGMQVFGFPARRFGAVETHDDRRDSMTIIARVAGDYDAVVAAALKAHGTNDCGQPLDRGPATCLVMSRDEGPWTIALGIVQEVREAGGSGISCTYARYARANR